MPLMIILGFGAVLFLLSFITKRRFGVLGLALCAGALLSQYFAGSATGFIEANGIVLVSPPLAIVVSVGLVLLPAVMLLFGGPKYNTRSTALIASAGFALLGMILTLPSLTAALVLDASARQVADFVKQYDALLIAVAIAAAVADMMLVHAPKFGRRSKGH